MTTKTNTSIIALERFIEATRDSGYKSTTSAISELVDNSIEAGANDIRVILADTGEYEDMPIEVFVVDNGSGMQTAILREALRFGGSSRFGSRRGLGRFGMGLPNASLSQSRRVEVVTWTRPQSVWTSYLDVDEIAGGLMTHIPAPTRTSIPDVAVNLDASSGTVVAWTACDRLDNRRISTVARKLQSALGRIFRHYIWKGVSITVNGQPAVGLDPLYLHAKSPFTGASAFADPIEFSVRVSTNGRRTGTVVVTFSELPVEDWCGLSVTEKRVRGISNGAGVSVVRAGREIDYGWFFMGGKRRENYDDWWRCEVHFDPPLDDAFGITHTKQQVRPQEHLLEAISPDLEEIAKTLNSRVRMRYRRARSSSQSDLLESKLAQQDDRLPALPRVRGGNSDADEMSMLKKFHRAMGTGTSGDNGSIEYRIVEEAFADAGFFRTLVDNGRVIIVINSQHPFYRKFYRRIMQGDAITTDETRSLLQALLLAAGRAEAMAPRRAAREVMANFRQHWGQALRLLIDDR